MSLAAPWPAASQRPLAAHSDDGKVAVSILSARLKQLEQGSLDRIVLRFDRNTKAFNKATGEHVQIREMRFSGSPSGIEAHLDGVKRITPANWLIHSNLSDAVFTVFINNEKRLYPLPLSIRFDGKQWRLGIREDKMRYALDAARAELGPDGENQTEALAALALLIRSRADMAGRNRRHDGFDFCDLTHCQIYAGRTASPIAFPWLIDIQNRTEPLSFSARCGGRTLGNRVFGNAQEETQGVRDWLISDGRYLCGQTAYEWETSIAEDELSKIIFSPKGGSAAAPVFVCRDDTTLRVTVRSGHAQASFAAEAFRLRLNRVRGWNFLPGNAYDIDAKIENGKRSIVFRGRGLGHGAGLCQTGALRLARLGYSRYEILSHYFPGLSFAPAARGSTPARTPVSYVVFNLKTGAVLLASHSDFLKRQSPPGSLFKLVVALYLLTKHPVSFDDYVFDCPRGQDKSVPQRCSIPEGHGPVRLSEALAQSCNLYFASLYSQIDPGRFCRFVEGLNQRTGMSISVPRAETPEAFARILCGLDHRIRLSVRDMTTLIQLAALPPTDRPNLEAAKQNLAPQARLALAWALHKTVSHGTASETGHPADRLQTHSLWGKTATFIDGTNRQILYGLFAGGDETRGLVVMQANGTGRDAAESAREIFSSLKSLDHQ